MRESKQVKIKNAAAIFRDILTHDCSDVGNKETIFKSVKLRTKNTLILL